MIADLIFPLTLLTALGCGLIGGFFFAFSACVMKALSRLPSGQAITTMQTINVVVLNRLFFAAFFGTSAGCVFLAISSLLRWNTPDAPYRLIASALYLLGTLMVTIVFNVPRNDALAKVEPDSAESAGRWAEFLPGWTAWNHVRAAAALLSAALFTIALCYQHT
jgi:uncharacterized membrane protein